MGDCEGGIDEEEEPDIEIEEGIRQTASGHIIVENAANPVLSE